MRKITLLLLITLFFASCRSDNDLPSKENITTNNDSNTNTNIDPIIGKWRLSKRMGMNKDGGIIKSKYSPCDTRGTIEYLPDHSVDHKMYSTNSKDECLSDEIYEYYKWELLNQIFINL